MHIFHLHRPAMTLLISVLVMGAVAIVIGASMAIRGVEEVDVGRSTVQTAEALAAAEACAAEALLQIKRNTITAGPVSLPAGDGSCEFTITGASPTYTIQSTGSVLRWNRGISAEVQVDGSTITIEQWEFDNFIAPPPDSVPPVTSAFSPPDDSVDVAVDTDLALTFNEAVFAQSAGSNAIAIYRTADDSLVESIAADSAQVTGDGTNTITIDLTDPLASETEYYVQIEAEALADAAGNLFAGISDTTTWSFTSADVNPPDISSLAPADDSVDVSIATHLSVTFNETVYPQSAGSNTITIYRASNNALVESVAADSAQVTGGGTTTIIVDLTNDLVKSKEYYVQIGAEALADAAGNLFAGISDTTTWNFTTGEGNFVCPVSGNGVTGLLNTGEEAGAVIEGAPLPPGPVIVGSITDSNNLGSPTDVAASGSYAYVIGSGYSGDTVAIVDVSDVTNPVVTAVNDVSIGLDRPVSITVQGKYIYIANYQQDSVWKIDISDPTYLASAGSINHSYQLNGASAVAVAGDYAYVTGSLGDSLAVLDISSFGFSILGFVSDATRMDGASSVAVAGNYAYVASPNSASLVVLDISNPASPTIVGDITGDTTNLADAESVAVDGNYAYVTGQSDVFAVVDISDPTNPTVVSGLSILGTGEHKVTVDGPYAYVAGTDDPLLQIVDISDPANPEVSTNVGEFYYGAGSVVVDGRYAYTTRYLDNTMYIVDLNNQSGSCASDANWDGSPAVISDRHSSWVGGDSDWISIICSGQYPASSTEHTFTLDIEVDSSVVSTLTLYGMFAADNYLSAMKVNGTDVPDAPLGSAGLPQYSSYTNFSIPPGSWVAGTNTISFSIMNNDDPESELGLSVIWDDCYLDSCDDYLYQCTSSPDCSNYNGGSGDACALNVCCGTNSNTCKYGFSGCGGGAAECRDGECYNSAGNPMGSSCTCSGL